MRLLEVLLILANILSLLLTFGKQPRGIWWTAAGINLGLFLIHAVFEGLRYQMIFSYGFVILFAGYAGVKTTSRFEQAKLTTALKVSAAGLAGVALALSALLAYALPVFSPPRPTGSSAVGIQYFHWVDETRSDPFLTPPTKKRELLVKLYYPAQADHSKPSLPYFGGSPELIRLFTSGYQMPAFMFDQLNLVKTHSKTGLAIADEQPSYPVILFSHGAGTSLETQTAQCEDLASHGYIVATIDHPYVSAATIFPDHIVTAREATTDFNTAEPAEVITQIMADDVEFVIGQLDQLNAGAAGPGLVPGFKGKLDMNHMGVIGHSVGGAVAYNLAINDPRVKAAINLDGVVYLTPTAGAQAVAPFLMLANDKYHVQAIENGRPLMPKLADMSEEELKFTLSIYGSQPAYQAAYDKAQQNVAGLRGVLRASGNLYTITGSDHMKFIDIGLFIGFRPLRELIGIAGSTDPARCLEISAAVSRAFFDQHLKGEPSPVDALVRHYPELKKVTLQ